MGMCFCNRIKLSLCMILCDHNPAFDGFNPLQGACNLRSVFGAFEHVDVSVACRKQLFGECVCVCFEH